jgi:hypothetical protein
MPALSQNFTFTINSSTSVQLDYPNTATTALTFFSDPVKGEGYYSNTDGIHTVQIHVNNFIGTIELQGSLATQPLENDWFPIVVGSNNLNVIDPDPIDLTLDTTGLIFGISNIISLNYILETSSVSSYNFKGNYVWIRAKISNFSQGYVGSIKYNF